MKICFNIEVEKGLSESLSVVQTVLQKKPASFMERRKSDLSTSWSLQ